MFGSFGIPELLLVLGIVILIFGVGRVGQVGKELGNAIRQFREGLTGDKKEEPKTEEKKDEKKA